MIIAFVEPYQITQFFMTLSQLISEWHCEVVVAVLFVRIVNNMCRITFVIDFVKKSMACEEMLKSTKYFGV